MAILLSVTLLLFFGGAQFYARIEAGKIQHELHQPNPDLAALVSQYRLISAWTPLSLGLSSVQDDLHEAVIGEADRMLDRYHGDDPTTTLKGWERARNDLRAALDLRPNDPLTQSRMIYVQAHLDRIATQTLRAQGKNVEAQAKLEAAISGFRNAARRDTGWPDPYLGLARIYSYESLDLAELQKALVELEKRGYPTGQREKSMLADAFRIQGRVLYSKATKTNEAADQTTLFNQAGNDLRQAINLYREIPVYALSRLNQAEAMQLLDEIENRPKARYK